jgi:sugar/nucleoside kinase (ribokinase family)
MKTCDVTVVGEIYIDHVMSGFETWPEPGSEVVTEHYAREVGGGGAITACGLGRLGKNTSLVGIIGADDARWLMNRLGDFGVGVQGLLTRPGPTGVTLSVSTREDRSFFTHIGVNRELANILLDREILLSLTRARHVHFAMPLAGDVAARILPTLRDAACTVSLDVGYQPAWLQDASNDATRQAVDYLLPNEKEAALLSGGESPEAYFAYTKSQRMRNAVLKLGARGAMSRVEGVTLSVKPPKVAAVDTTGSGDAFDAGFIDALLEDESMEDCLRRACICGALSTRVAGALAGLPTREELWSTYEQTYRS